jgi:type IV secretory pathway TraG/TraD family ATPase VirD4
MKNLYLLLSMVAVVGALLLLSIEKVWNFVVGLIWRPKPSTTHGDAEWANIKQLKKAGNLEAKGFYLCRFDGKRVFTHHERSALMMAAPGTGKSQTIIAGVHALKYAEVKPSLIISDSANEIYDACADTLTEMGYTVGKIDLQKPEMGAKYDILSMLRKTHLDTDLEDLCDLLLPPDRKDPHPHFRTFARSMVSDAIALNVKYEGNTKSIAEIAMELIDDDQRDALIKRMKKHGSEFAAVKLFERLGSNEGPGMLSTSLNHLRVWSADRIRRVSLNGLEEGKTVNRGWTWEDVLTHEKPSAIFIRTGLSGGTAGAQFTRVVMGNAVNTVMRMWDALPRPLPRPMRIIADEAADMGRCTAIVKAHNLLRKAHVTVMLCFLSKSALDTTYGDDAETLWNGCDHLVFGGCKDNRTNKAYSELIGQATRLTGSTDATGASRGFSEMGAPLIRPNQILQLGKGEAIAYLGSLPVKGEKAYWFDKKGMPQY